MNDEQKQVILGLVSAPGRPPTTSPEAVLRAFDTTDGPALGLRLLADAVERHDADDVEFALLVSQTFGFTDDHLPLLLQLSVADWHFKHEDVVWYLGEYNGPLVVSALERATEWVPDYLDFDDSRALARKAIWELGKQPGDEARRALAKLAESDNELIRNEATHQLHR